MIVNLLTKALREKIAEAVKDFRLPVENGAERSPRILNGYIPPKQMQPDDDFPVVMVRADDGRVNIEDGTAETTVAIFIGCYFEGADGHEFCLNVMQRIAIALTTLPASTLDNRYILQSIDWKNIDDQPYPFWELQMSTKWSYIAPQPQCEF